ncbi:16S rRNA (guanine(966)-N(2))-methyltransferase RsmD [Leifsonia sp. fls2-241-R2A-40a]|uniref:16S rRNA (guanine(966)-N(2))-methyltransferase RsmD n=1 Tax=Leifsonia sp. fls2-241-R2A-40a TaxID=3040290 RepID=UPI00254E18B6|nr:16S rRNA (guanine(966)-N(2))-methyltransferase RsmD [Leifsonia sp. fls2-241-R2A-40a]
MTRIVSGFAGSLALQVPKSGTRPTSDRVREALFSALDARDAVRGARVLDLYAGSGALGLEAASRGAVSVVLVERSPAAAQVCQRNAAAVTSAARAAGGTQPTIDVRAASVQSYLAGAAGPFDVVFIDPPYLTGDEELSGVLASLVPLLADDAVVCVERSARDPEPTIPDGLAVERRKDYGETAIYWLAPDRA